jgi:hypothetical protein
VNCGALRALWRVSICRAPNQNPGREFLMTEEPEEDPLQDLQQTRKPERREAA